MIDLLTLRALGRGDFKARKAIVENDGPIDIGDLDELPDDEPAAPFWNRSLPPAAAPGREGGEDPAPEVFAAALRILQDHGALLNKLATRIADLERENRRLVTEINT